MSWLGNNSKAGISQVFCKEQSWGRWIIIFRKNYISSPHKNFLRYMIFELQLDLKN
jgi:hypothetical protein